MQTYQDFLKGKALTVQSAGVEVELNQINSILFPFQRDLVRWSLKKGRAALFADTGLGKTFMQLEWARFAAQRTLILAPLAVARQTVLEASKLGLVVTYARSQAQAAPTGITITNYEMLGHFDPDYFGAVVLDESSILKSFEGKTRTALIKAFQKTPMRLACTATPAPNDISEIANHAEFLGVMKREEMLAAFFVHDDDGWRLKGHARRGPFYQWLASWAMSIRKPSDLGYPDDGYILPGLEINPIFVKSDYIPAGKLFHDKLSGVTERAEVRKATLKQRVEEAARLINSIPGKQWLAWCGLNDEGRDLAKLIPGAVLVEGSQSPDEKAEALTKFASGEISILITKPSIAGFGLNFQKCSHMVFIGLGDSYEQYYQAIRRCYRFGQTEKVKTFIVLSDIEETIFQNVLRKEKEAITMAEQLVKHVATFEKEELGNSQQSARLTYSQKDVSGQNWKILLGDSGERLAELADNSIDFSVFSEPFASLYTYSASDRDLGNCKDYDTFWQQFAFITKELYRVLKPGRLIAAHVQQLPLTKATDGVIGIRDFRGHNIEHFTKQGFIYHGEVCIDKDPQAQAIRTKNKGLLFVQLHKDSSWSRPAFADYILLFRKPGDNATPIVPDVTNDEWIQFARPIWYGIKESDTLNTVEARSSDDERHICPLQLGTIERCIRLWSNAGETILDPFNGIGSIGYVALKYGRKYIGVELNPVYFNVAVKNLKEAERQSKQQDLFSLAGIDMEGVA